MRLPLKRARNGSLVLITVLVILYVYLYSNIIGEYVFNPRRESAVRKYHYSDYTTNRSITSTSSSMTKTDTANTSTTISLTTSTTSITTTTTTTTTTPSPPKLSSSTPSVKTNVPTATPTTTTTTTTTEEAYSCSFPFLDPFDPFIRQHIEKHDPLVCKGKPSVAYFEGNTIIIDEKRVNETIGSVDYCQYTPIKLAEKNDKHLEALKWSAKFKTTKEIPEDLEHLLVACMKNNSVVAESYISRIFEKPQVEEKAQRRYAEHIKEYNPSETLSVMFVGLDAMSKQNIIRTMPKTRNFILENMNAKELNMFNKVGYNTFENVAALHTGKTHHEFETIPGWNMREDYFEDIDYLFAWNAYQKAGYRTSSFFDYTTFSAFHYLKMGWKNPPFDYNHRASLLLFNGRSKESFYSNCVGDQREATLLLDYFLQITAKFNNTKTKPYFAYGFFGHLTHDNQNHASMGDEMYLEFFTKLHRTNVLNNTLLVFFSDHGPRFGPMRLTLNGFVEGRSPFFFLMFPPWFEKKYPKEMMNLQTNQNRLTTFFDGHATLYDLLYFRGKRPRKFEDIKGTSLFEEIPSNRTCKDAMIPDEYCLCKDISKKAIPDDLKQELAVKLLDMINDRTKQNRNICAKLSIKSVRSVHSFDDKSQRNYQVTLQTTPGDGDFEALLSINEDAKTTKLIGGIVRLNFYKGQDGCVDTLALKPYCYCTV